MAEHHNSAASAGTAPEVLIAAIAATTRRIRVGSAGVMLPHYSALKVAEQFRVLEAIAPGRIDLGLGRAPGSDGLTAYALNPNAATAADHVPAPRCATCWPGVAGEPLVEKHPFRDIRAQPTGGHACRRSGSSAAPTTGRRWRRISGCHTALPISSPTASGAAEALDLYRTSYRPSERASRALCRGVRLGAGGRHEAEAERLFSSRALGAARAGIAGCIAPLPSPAEAAAFEASDADRARLDRVGARSIHGTAPQVADRLRAMAGELGVQEVAVLTTVHEAEARRRSYSLLAQEFGLAAMPLAAE